MYNPASLYYASSPKTELLTLKKKTANYLSKRVYALYTGHHNYSLCRLVSSGLSLYVEVSGGVCYAKK